MAKLLNYLVQSLNSVLDRQPQAGYDVIPDTTGSSLFGDGLTDSFIDVHMRNGTELPRHGDIVISLTSCGMGVSVSSEARYRILSEPLQKGDSKAVYGLALAETRHAPPRWFHPHKLRRHAKIARVWWEYN